MRPIRPFRWPTGWITVGAANQGNWLRLLEALGAPELGNDPRFVNNADRMRNLPALQAALTPLFKDRSSAEWLQRLEESGRSGGAGAGRRPNARRSAGGLAREMIVETSHPTAGQVASIGLPIKFSENARVRAAARRQYLGQHTREVLREHGFSDAEGRPIGGARCYPDAGLD